MSNETTTPTVTPGTLPAYTRKDFLTGTDPRWCPGCGDYAAFNGLTRVFMAAGVRRENFAVISGIGCSSRFPYYSNTYGFHTIHGRAPTVAIGAKMANPELNVWITTGDGDGLSIGGNHFIHLLRRNPNIKIVVFNNQIYGLTKGQTSPTSPLGTKTKTTPQGSQDRPMHPMTLALGAGATFVARVTDSDNELMYKTLMAAQEHQGIAVIEILLNCVIFNDGAFAKFTEKATRPDTTVVLEHGKPLIFGAARNRGIRLNGDRPEVVTIGENGIQESDLLVHDLHNPNTGYAFMLAEMDSPLPLGVLRQSNEHVHEVRTPNPTAEGFEKVLRGSSAWHRSEDGRIESLES